MNIILEGEKGNRLATVFDTHGILLTLIFETAEKDSECRRLLDFVDPYGDVVFNWLQMKQLSIELDDLSQSAESPEAQDLLSGIQALVKQGLEGVHLYLRLMGD